MQNLKSLEHAKVTTSVLTRTVPQEHCIVCSRAGQLAAGPIKDRAHDIPGDWSFLFCKTCELAWLNPKPVFDDIGLGYPTNYYTHNADDLERIHEIGWKGYARKALLASCYGYEAELPSYVRFIARLLHGLPPIRYRLAFRTDNAIPHWRSDGKLLDIGCGAGSFLATAQTLGWEAYGLDPDPTATETARRTTNAQVWEGLLDTVDIPAEYFDAVSSMHSIEHAPDPAEFLKLALRPLKKGGFFYLQTPNWNSLTHRRAGSDWYALEPPRHLCMLTPRSVARLCSNTRKWKSLTVRTLSRRASIEQKQWIAMLRTGSFHGDPRLSWIDRCQVEGWSLIEKLGNSVLQWGEEIEVIGIAD